MAACVQTVMEQSAMWQLGIGRDLQPGRNENSGVQNWPSDPYRQPFSTPAEPDILRALLAYISGAVNTWTVGAYSKFMQALTVFFFFLQATNKGNKMHKKHQNWTLHMKASPENRKAFSSKGEHCKSVVRKGCMVSEDTSSLLFMVFHVCMSNHRNNIELRKWAMLSKV